MKTSTAQRIFLEDNDTHSLAAFLTSLPNQPLDYSDGPEDWTKKGFELEEDEDEGGGCLQVGIRIT